VVEGWPDYLNVDYLKNTAAMILALYMALYPTGLKVYELLFYDRLHIQVQAYLENMIDVAMLVEDSEMKNTALERVQDLEESLSHVSVTAPGTDGVQKIFLGVVESSLVKKSRFI
jgi:hypothetical protein